MSPRPPSAYVKFDESSGEWGIVDADTSQILWTDVGGRGTQEQADVVALRMQKQGMIILMTLPEVPETVCREVVSEEQINHPSHYGGDTTYEYVKVARAWGLEQDALLWTAGKYLCRQGKKGGEPALKDLKKIMWYVQERINVIELANIEKELSEDVS